jgi:hypothetical protein
VIPTWSDLARGHVWRTSPYSGTALLVHLAAAEHVDVDGVVRASAVDLVTFARTTIVQVRRALGALVDDGWAEVVEPARGRNAAVYRLLFPTLTGAARAATPDVEARTTRVDHVDADVSQPPLLTCPNEIPTNNADADASTRASRSKREPREHEAEARAITAEAWEQITPKPAVPFVAVVKIVEPFVGAGWPRDRIVAALVAVPTISTRWVEAELRGKASGPQGERAMITDRSTPGGTIPL